MPDVLTHQLETHDSELEWNPDELRLRIRTLHGRLVSDNVRQTLVVEG